MRGARVTYARVIGARGNARDDARRRVIDMRACAHAAAAAAAARARAWGRVGGGGRREDEREVGIWDEGCERDARAHHRRTRGRAR